MSPVQSLGLNTCDERTIDLWRTPKAKDVSQLWAFRGSYDDLSSVAGELLGIALQKTALANTNHSKKMKTTINICKD